MGEIWKDIPGYEGLYQASNKGQIRSLDKDVWNGHAYYKVPGRIMRPKIKNSGYKELVLRKNNKAKSITVHRLVCITFNGDKRNEHPVVCHRDGDSLNNNAENLYWATHKQNSQDMIDHGNSTFGKKARACQLNKKQVLEIYKSKKSNKALAKEYNIGEAAISSIKRGKNWWWLTTGKRYKAKKKEYAKKLNDELALKIYDDNRIAREIAEEYGVGIDAVYRIKQKKTWAHIHN